MKKLVFLSLLSVALLTSCGNGAQKDALKAQNDSLMVELSNRNAELDDIMGAFNEVQEDFGDNGTGRFHSGYGAS